MACIIGKFILFICIQCVLEINDAIYRLMWEGEKNLDKNLALMEHIFPINIFPVRKLKYLNPMVDGGVA